jgi:hypothetical protein
VIRLCALPRALGPRKELSLGSHGSTWRAKMPTVVREPRFRFRNSLPWCRSQRGDTRHPQRGS